MSAPFTMVQFRNHLAEVIAWSCEIPVVPATVYRPARKKPFGAAMSSSGASCFNRKHRKTVKEKPR